MDMRAALSAGTFAAELRPLAGVAVEDRRECELLQARVGKVRLLHVARPDRVSADPQPVCDTCSVVFPCDTIRALEDRR